MALEEYQKKRDFGKTPEPAGTGAAGSGSADEISAEPRADPASGANAGRLLFVGQKHDASRLHYDFRLELDGVLLSWAVPKGPSLDPRDKRLAARVEDHPLEYGSFEGTIPEGEYGAGTVLLWDRGYWEPAGDPHEGLRKGDLKFTLHGEKLRGGWVLVRMRPRPGQKDEDNWLLIKHRDDEAVDGDGQAVLAFDRSVASGRNLEEIAAAGQAGVRRGDAPADRRTEVRAVEESVLDPSTVPGARAVARMPRFVKPALATLVQQAPAGDDWRHEVKFDGYRTLSRIEDGKVEMFSRNGIKRSGAYSVLVEELAALPVESALLDGEVVVQLSDGRTDFQALQEYLGSRSGVRGGARGRTRGNDGDHSAAGSQRDLGQGRLLYYVFDLLYLNGYELLEASLQDRKELLRRLFARIPRGGRLLFSDHVAGDGPALLEQACAMGLEGVVSKAARGRYHTGERGGEWLKTKCRRDQEFVVGGYTAPGGGRVGFGALLVGAYQDGVLRYVGKVGTGFDEALLRRLSGRLRELEVDEPPFEAGLARAPKDAHWVRPVLVAQVAFMEWTWEGGLRHPAFKGLREDKSPAEVEVESAPTMIVNGVTISHPEKLLWPGDGITKRRLVMHYDAVASWMLPYVLGRPVAMVRCPGGIGDLPASVRGGKKPTDPCFYHKHPSPDFPGPFGRVTIEESDGPAPYLTITEPGSLTALAQMGVLEIHVWGSTWPDIEHPDLLVFDLDPDPAVDWKMLADAARLVREVLLTLGLESFVKTTGGKGLHVQAPISPTEDWDTVRSFCKAVADVVVAHDPRRYTSQMAKAKRTGKIFIDYMRNNRGATSIAPYSTRAREHATVAVPLRWRELSGSVRPDAYTVGNIQARLSKLKGDPWEGYAEAGNSQGLAQAVQRVAGVGVPGQIWK